MLSFVFAVSIALYSGSVLALPSLHAARSKWSNSTSERANAVKAAFETAWGGYYEYAFPNDELLPVNNTFGDSRNGWGASAIDALTTAILMENQTIVDEILAHVPEIDFGVSYEDEAVSLFETTIRYLGGMLSAYDLLKGPLAGLATNDTQVDSLLEQAKNLADHLSFAFDTPTGVPSNNLFFSNTSTDGSTSNGLATIGSLILEWTRLSDLTGNTTYSDLAQKGESYLLNPECAAGINCQPFAGLVGTNVNISNGLFLDGDGGWNGGDDSFYEYLLKFYIYDSSRYTSYLDRWILAAESTIANLDSHPSSRPDLTFIAGYEGTNLTYEFSHLGCFAGGNFLLGGIVLNNSAYTDFGLAVTAGCHDTYISTATGIGPELFSWVVSGANTSVVPANQSAFYQDHGFYITDSDYILRPEVMESYYYAYRSTSDPKYQDWAWEAFLAITGTTRVGSGYSEISDVDAVDGGTFYNFQDSFFFAEVLKYAFLIFADGAAIQEVQVQGQGNQGWVFNTEAHPVKVQGPGV